MVPWRQGGCQPESGDRLLFPLFFGVLGSDVHAEHFPDAGDYPDGQAEHTGGQADGADCHGQDGPVK